MWSELEGHALTGERGRLAVSPPELLRTFLESLQLPVVVERIVVKEEHLLDGRS
jgi:hypothetical protein